MKTKFYKYECTDCKKTTIETNNNGGHLWIKTGVGCTRCKSLSFELIKER